MIPSEANEFKFLVFFAGVSDRLISNKKNQNNYEFIFWNILYTSGVRVKVKEDRINIRVLFINEKEHNIFEK